MLRIDLQHFGGRGASSAGGGGGYVAKGELVLPDGSKIEFEGNLGYGGDDKAVSGNARTAITSWEAKRVKNKVEYAYSVDPDGTPVGSEIRGSKGSVRVPLKYHDTPDAVFSHVHPRGDGMLGGTFSSADLRNFANHKNKTVRATAKEGTYSISKTKKFDSRGASQYFTDCHSEFTKGYRKKADSLYYDYKSSKISYDEYLKGNAKAFNTALVKLHNDYAAGQKKYGYTYTLEKTN